MSLQDADLVREHLGRRPRVPFVRVLGGDPHRPLLASAADQQRQRFWTGAGWFGASCDVEVVPVEGRPLLPEQRDEDLRRLLEPVEPFLDRPELDAVGGVLVLLPAGADPEQQASVLDVVDGRRDVGEDGRDAGR